MNDNELKSLAGQLRDAARGERMDRAHLLLMHEAADALDFMRYQRQLSKEQFDHIAAQCGEILHGEL